MRWLFALLLGLSGAVAAPSAAAAKPDDGETKTEPDPKPPAPQPRYVSRGILSRFSVGAGLHLGFNTGGSRKPILGGASVHVRVRGIVGFTVEYDFNRVARDPTTTPPPQVSDLHFIPNLRFHVVLHPYRWRFVSPYLILGAGLDVGGSEDRANFQFGLGVELTFWKHHIGVAADVRTFLPQPSNVQKFKERVQIHGGTVPKNSAFYNLKNTLITLAVRFYY